MDRIAKFLRKLQPKLRQQLKDVIAQLARNETKGLDISPMSGKPNWYRCRVGAIRIVYFKNEEGSVVIYKIGFRGDVYK